MVENGRHMSSCACKLYSVMASIKCALDTEGGDRKSSLLGGGNEMCKSFNLRNSVS